MVQPGARAKSGENRFSKGDDGERAQKCQRRKNINGGNKPFRVRFDVRRSLLPRFFHPLDLVIPSALSRILHQCSPMPHLFLFLFFPNFVFPSFSTFLDLFVCSSGTSTPRPSIINYNFKRTIIPERGLNFIGISIEQDRNVSHTTANQSCRSATIFLFCFLNIYFPRTLGNARHGFASLIPPIDPSGNFIARIGTHRRTLFVVILPSPSLLLSSCACRYIFYFYFCLASFFFFYYFFLG